MKYYFDAKNFTKLVIYMFNISLLISCGGGHKVNNTTNTPTGPASYSKTANTFTTTNPNTCNTNTSLQEILKASSYNNSNIKSGLCGAVMSDAGAATGFFSFIPVVGPALGALSPVLTLFGANNGNACVEQQISQINLQLAAQESQIQNIQNILQLDQNAFYQQNYQTAVEIAGLNEQNYNNALTSLIGTSGLNLGIFGNFMITLQLWLAGGQINPAVAQSNNFINSISTNSNILTTAQDAISGHQTQFQNYVINISGANYSSCSNNCYLTVRPIAQASLPLTLASLYQALVASIQENQDIGQNFVPALDQYNNTISSIFQQSAYALNDAFQMEYLVNQINYYNAVNYISSNNSSTPTSLTQLSSFTNVPATHYNYSNETCVGQININYNKAQQQLALFYAALENQLYINVANYIVSDLPIQGQAWPTVKQQFTSKAGKVEFDYNTISYGQVFGKKIATPISVIPNEMKITNTNGVLWANNSILYQYSGIQNIAACANTIDSQSSAQNQIANILNNQNCPSLFLNTSGQPENQGQFNWNSQLQPYYIANGQTQGQLSPTINLINNCSGNAVASSNNSIVPPYNLYWYTPGPNSPLYSIQSGTAYLMCGNWPQITNSFTGNGRAYYINASFNASLWGPLYQNGDAVTFSTPNNSSLILMSNPNGAWTNNAGYISSLLPSSSFSSGQDNNFGYYTVQYTATDGFIGSLVIGAGYIFIGNGTEATAIGDCGYDDYVAQYNPCFFINGNINPYLNNLQILNLSTGAISSLIMNSQNGSAISYQNAGYGNYNLGSGASFFQYNQNGNTINYIENYSKDYGGPASTNIIITSS